MELISIFLANNCCEVIVNVVTVLIISSGVYFISFTKDIFSLTFSVLSYHFNIYNKSFIFFYQTNCYYDLLININQKIQKLSIFFNTTN